jgi:hypothetical protein
MRVRELRFLTVTLVAACCGWTLLQGFAFVRYQFAAPGLQQSWEHKTGLAMLALRQAANDAVDLERRRGLLEALLEVEPTSSQSWISLAAVRNSLNMQPDAVVAAYRMSTLTGPNEGAIMFQRALFGVLLWEKLPAETRQHAAADLCGLTNFDPGRFRIVLGIKPNDIRAAIRTELTSHGCPADRLKYIGL